MHTPHQPALFLCVLALGFFAQISASAVPYAPLPQQQKLLVSTPGQNVLVDTGRKASAEEAALEQQKRERAEQVKDAFKSAWKGYWERCRGEDELLPVSNTCGNPRNHWGASAVDALSTALVMEIGPIVDDILTYVPSIDFTRSDAEVSVFETTIRYLAGLLSGYDLLTGPLAHLSSNETAVQLLLSQAQSLANALIFAFETPSGIPHNDVNIPADTNNESPTNGLATTGTLILEWERLSDLTGNLIYGQLAQKAEAHLLDPKPAHNSPFPGLVGTNINITTGEFVDASGGWNGGDDSFYEYLIKMYVYSPNRFQKSKDRWILAADSTMRYLASHPDSRPDLTFLATFDNATKFNNVSQHLACFAGGNFLLGGSVLHRQDYIDFGLNLTESCHETYAATLTGIGPEVFSWDIPEPQDVNAKFYHEHGFYVANSLYVLRPEVIESYYYAYRITGDRKYQQYAWDAFVAINTTCRVGNGFSSIGDVDAYEGGGFLNEQESFLFAEVMKYAYLIHAPDSEFQVQPPGVKNGWVFNTEAHPFKIAG